MQQLVQLHVHVQQYHSKYLEGTASSFRSRRVLIPRAKSFFQLATGSSWSPYLTSSSCLLAFSFGQSSSNVVRWSSCAARHWTSKGAATAGSGRRDGTHRLSYRWSRESSTRVCASTRPYRKHTQAKAVSCLTLNLVECVTTARRAHQKCAATAVVAYVALGPPLDQTL